MTVGERRLRSARPSDAPGPVAWWRREVAMNVAYRWGMVIMIGLAVIAAVILVVGSARADVVSELNAPEVTIPPAREVLAGRVAEYYAAFARHDFAATWFMRHRDLRAERVITPYVSDLEKFFTGVAITVGPSRTWFKTVRSGRLIGFASVWLEFHHSGRLAERICHVTAWVWERSWPLGPEHWYFFLGELSAGDGCDSQTEWPGWRAPSRLFYPPSQKTVGVSPRMNVGKGG